MGRLERILLAICLLLAIMCRCEGQKLSEEEPLEAGQGSGFNPDDEDFEASGLPPENSVDDVHPVVKTSFNSMTSSSPTTTRTAASPTSVPAIRRPPQVTTGNEDAGDKASNKGLPFNSTHIIVGAVAFFLVVLIIVIVIARCCCCRKSKNQEYSQGTARSKSYV